ncbi:MAG: O-antigen ligase family protein [Elusimicrobia bacterium]|nr:O-antigen ligase family protein [Elusimicrobiota bacterium]
MTRLLTPVFVFLQFVCPLIFFTDLTRNPYITQIALLHIGICAAAALWALEGARRGELSLPRTPLDAPMAAWLAVCALSWLIGYFGHAAFFRESVLAEGTRVLYFTVVNCVIPFYLAAQSATEISDESPSPARWAIFCLVWGVLWLFFQQLRAQTGPFGGLWVHTWDPYGGLLWIAGTAALIWMARGGTVHDIWHVALAGGFLAAAYGILQYFNIELIWQKTLNPYGGRSVSTFGNPNFMSSYLVVVFPLAIVYYLKARTRGQRAVYALMLLAFEAALLCSLTRSSWVGAAGATALLALSPELRRLARQDPQFTGFVVTAAAMMAVFWPQSLISGQYSSSVIGRLSEVTRIAHPSPGEAFYSPWHQRKLIWTCAWQMGAESPLFGKGWGLFELFYPFFQGNILDHFDFFRNMRTHANNAHNEILEVWAQAGILGVGVLFWTWAVFFRSLWDGAAVKPKTAKAKEPVWLYAAGAGIAGMLLDNLLNVSLHFAVPAFIFWWQAGIAMGALAHAQGRRRALSKPAASAAAALLIAACAWGAWQGVRMWYREAYYFIGFKHVRSSRLKEAIEALDRAYRWHPREVNSNYELGNAYARSDQPQKAVWAYREALNANAGYDEIYFNLATILSTRIGDREGAEKNFLTSWAINPLSHDLYVNFMALLLREPGKNADLVVELLERAVHFFPENLNFRNNLGYLYSLKRDYAKAEGAYGELLRRQPGFQMAEQNLMTSLRQSGNKPPEVLARLDDLRRLEQMVRVQDFGPASLDLARRLGASFPDDVRTRFYLGNLELIRGDPAKAAEGLRFVLSREPGNVPALINYGHALKRLSRLSEAAAAFRAALEADPKNPIAAAELKALKGPEGVRSGQ